MRLQKRRNKKLFDLKRKKYIEQMKKKNEEELAMKAEAQQEALDNQPNLSKAEFSETEE